LQGDPLDSTSGKSFDLVRATRKRKGMPEEIPELDRFIDKL